MDDGRSPKKETVILNMSDLLEFEIGPSQGLSLHKKLLISVHDSGVTAVRSST
jgi:hypothetical protein